MSPSLGKRQFSNCLFAYGLESVPSDDAKRDFLFCEFAPRFSLCRHEWKDAEMMADHFFDVLSRASRFHVGDRGDA